MHTFEIRIQRKYKESWPVIVEYTKPGRFVPTRHQGALKLNNDNAFDELRSLLDLPRDYGTMLGKALFYDSVRDAFVAALRTLEDSKDNQDCLQVLLDIEADDLKELQWEKLCAPVDGDWDFLALKQKTPFSLYIPAITERLFPSIGQRDLQALVVVANPENLGEYTLAPFDVQATVSSVKEALGEIPCDVLAKVDGAIGLPTLDEVMRCLTNNDKYYTLLHLVCHGKLLRDVRDGETALYLADVDNRVAPVAGSILLERLRRLGRAPHFAFLSTCESASPEAEAGVGGLAQRLVRELGMPAVVAMTEKVSICVATCNHNRSDLQSRHFSARIKSHIPHPELSQAELRR